jgi:D-alanyl-D-alanine carboxypeptidase
METSYNGWPASPDKAAINIQPFGDAYGCPFPGGVKGGDVATVLAYVCTQLHNRVEPAVAGWLWGYSYRANVNNPSVLSCHSSGTAVDWNAPDHPNGAQGTFSDDQVGTIYSILAEVQGAVQWGGDYSGTVDEMHFEIIVDAGTLANVAVSLPSSGPAPIPEPPPDEDEDDDMKPMIVQRANGVDYAHNPLRLITITDPDMYVFLQANHWIDVPHGEAEVVDRNVIEFTAAQVIAGGGHADPLI